MKFRLIALFVIAAALLAGCTFSLSEDITPPPGYQSPTPPPDLGDLYPAEPPSPAVGAAIYTEKCLPCHGETGLGNGPMASQLPVTIPAVGLREVYNQSVPADWYTIVTQGNLDRGMPPFLSLNDQERWDVLAYTYTMNLPADEIARGAELYAVNCAQCHGPQGDLIPEANLADPQFMAGQSGTSMFRAINEGVPPTMPALGGQLSEDDIWTLVDHVRTLAFDMTAPAEPTPVPPTATPEPTATVEAATAETTPGAETTPAATPEGSPTPEVPTTATISGAVTNASGAALPSGLTATLHIFDMVSSQEIGTTETPVSGGTYLFTGIPFDDQSAYIVSIMYQDVSYSSEPAFYDGITSAFDLPVTVYGSTTDFNVLQVSQVHVVMDFSTSGSIQVMEYFLFTNPGNASVIVPVSAEVTSIPFIQTPLEAGADIVFQLSDSSADLLYATNGFAIQPGADLQYGIVASYTLPYDRRLEVDLPFALPVETLNIIAPTGVRIRGDRLTDQGPSTMGETEYHTYEATGIAAGESLALTISGMPGETGLFPLTKQNGIIIGMGALGVVLIAAGVYLFLRDRARSRVEDEELDESEDSLGDDPQAIMDAIIVLDDQFKAGSLAKEAYEERRAALLARLKGLA